MAGPDWKLLETFVRVAETGSLTAAARALGTSQPTASRAIAALEEELGASLFVRHSRGLGLTERGAELFAEAKRLDDGVQALFRHAAGLRELPAGTVRLSVNEPLGVHVLPPCFAALRRDYPDITLEVVIDNAVSNLSRREADVAVRMFRPEQLDLVARKVGSVLVGLFASKQYVKRHGVPASLADAKRHTLIGSDRDPSWARGIAKLGLSPADFAFRTDNLLAQIQAIVAGVGIGGTQVGIARKLPELVRVLPELAFEPLETWVVMHQDLRGSPAVRVVFEAVSELLVKHTRGDTARRGAGATRSG
jgi:DNA-binding transcriptional LysR family regulator